MYVLNYFDKHTRKGGDIMDTKHIDPQHVGLTLGSFVALAHLVWSIFVAMGVAQSFQDWVIGLHFLNNPFHVGTFNAGTALMLIIVTFIVGYVVGWVFATIWNKVGEK